MLPYIEKSIIQLERAGADFIVLPCNTLHLLLPYLRKKFKIQILDMAEEVSKSISHYNKIGVLCTTKTMEEKLYDSLLKEKVVYPNKQEQEELSEIIVRIIRKEFVKKDIFILENIIKNLFSKGCEIILLACTDIGNLINSNDRIIDTTDILIESIKKKLNLNNYQKAINLL